MSNQERVGTAMQPSHLRAATVSLGGRVASGELPDTRGDRIETFIASLGGRLVERVLIDMNQAEMHRQLCRLADEGVADLVFTTGSVGIAAHDIAADVVGQVIDFHVPGMADAMRAHSIQRDPLCMLSRYVVGVRGATLIATLPGKIEDLADILELLRPVLPDAVRDLRTRAPRGAPAG